MTAVCAPTAAPPSAVRLWREGRDLLVEFPSASGIPYIMRIADTPSAVAKVMGLIHGVEQKPMQRRSFGKSEASVRKVISKDTYSEEQRANARAVLKRMGIT